MYAGAKPEIFQFAKMLRANTTFEEKKLWSFLGSKPLGFKFRRQHPFAEYVLDFYCHRVRLSIEIDGKNHNTKEQKIVDLNRTRVINSFGVTEIRYTNEAIRLEFEDVKNDILKILDDHLIKQ